MQPAPSRSPVSSSALRWGRDCNFPKTASPPASLQEQLSSRHPQNNDIVSRYHQAEEKSALEMERENSAKLTEMLAAIRSPKSQRKPQRPLYKTSAEDQTRRMGHAAFTRLSLPPARGWGSQAIAVLCPQPSVPPLHPSNRWQPGEGVTAEVNTLIWFLERACAQGNHRGGAKNILGHLPACLKGELLQEMSESLIRV